MIGELIAGRLFQLVEQVGVRVDGQYGMAFVKETAHDRISDRLAEPDDQGYRFIHLRAPASSWSRADRAAIEPISA